MLYDNIVVRACREMKSGAKDGILGQPPSDSRRPSPMPVPEEQHQEVEMAEVDGSKTSVSKDRNKADGGVSTPKCIVRFSSIDIIICSLIGAIAAALASEGLSKLKEVESVHLSTTFYLLELPTHVIVEPYQLLFRK